jgi:hypothetical protein
MVDPEFDFESLEVYICLRGDELDSTVARMLLTAYPALRVQEKEAEKIISANYNYALAA